MKNVGECDYNENADCTNQDVDVSIMKIWLSNLKGEWIEVNKEGIIQPQPKLTTGGIMKVSEFKSIQRKAQCLTDIPM